MEILIGTKNAMVSLNSASSAQINGAVLLTCFANDESFSFSNTINGVITSYYIEASSAINPMTGGVYTKTNPMQNTTAFTQDKLYEDMPNRYQITTSGENEFSKTFPNTNLSCNEISVASTTFHLSELGHTPIVLIYPTEYALLNFAKQQKWRYILLEDTQSGTEDTSTTQWL